MDARERLEAVWRGKPPDHIPLTTWCFGLKAPPHLRWQRGGRDVEHWYTKRLEHIHTLPQEWTLEDDFRRALAWQSLGVDDVLDVSIPWGVDPDVQWTERLEEAGALDPRYPVRVRDYRTPSGALRHAVRQTTERPGPGWVIQPDSLPLFEDFNVPRGTKHAVADADDIAPVRHLYRPPSEAEVEWLERRMRQVGAFADEHGVPVQAWCAFGMDAAVWMAGVQGAIRLAMKHAREFGRLMDQITETDAARTELAARTPGVGLLVERGWYASTEFWSPRLLDTYLFPHIAAMSKIAHAHDRPFGYVMTTGIHLLGERLAKAGVDVLYFVDPFQDKITLESARELLASGMTLAGGISSLQLYEPPAKIRASVERAMDMLGGSSRFILHPVDSLFPDTPWEGVEAMIEAWKQCT